MTQRLRIFVSSPGDVTAARQIAALTIERLAQDYARFFHIEPYLWEFEAMVASGHFQDSIEPPSAFDVVVLILWSRLGTHLPERTSVREYRGLDGRTPVTGTEWEFEEAFQAAKQTGAPDLLVYRSLKQAPFNTHDPERLEEQLQQVKALNRFWERHFANQGMFIGAYTSFTSDAEFAASLENHLRKLIERRIASIGIAQMDAAAHKVWTQAPFRGLEAYEFEHAPIFFGQDETLAKAMLQLMGDAEAGSPFLLVLGASGSGKSSLVKAGILPKLFVPRRIAGSAFLRRVVFRPSDAREGEDLFDALARRLTTQVTEQEGLSELIGHGQSPASLAAHLRNATAAPAFPIGTALGQLTVQARQSGGMLEYETAKLVLVIDQLEELFTSDRIPPMQRVQFIELLAGLVRSGLVWIVTTMRKDFWHRADETPELVRLSEGHGRLELLPPGPAQLSQMIRRPAEAAGVSFEVHGTTSVPLNEVIAQEVAREPGALPLLSYLLDQLYRNDVLDAHRDTLTYATYERLGKLEGAIATKAEAVLERCVPEDRLVLGSVLFSLVEMGTATGDVERAVARRVPLSTFQPGTPHRRLVEAFLDPDARLLVSDAEKGGSPTVRVAHEALISRWERAREYVRSNAEALKIRHRIEERYALWRGLKEGGLQPTQHETSLSPSLAARLAVWRSRLGRESGLLTDIDLTDGRRLLKEHRTDTEAHLIAYIERSDADNKRMRTRTVRLLTSIASVVTVLAIVASIAGLIASRKQHEAEYQAAQTLAAQSRLLIQTASERLKRSDVSAAQQIILEVLTNPAFSQTHSSSAISVFQEIRATDTQLIAMSGHSDRVYAVGYAHNGKELFTTSYDKTARTWDAFSGAPLTVLSGHTAPVTSAAYSADDARIVTASLDGTARIWDARAGVVVAVLSGHMGAVNSVAYAPDGTRIVTGSDDKTARIWDARTGAVVAVLSGHMGAVNSVAYSPDGTRIVTGSDDKTARIWDVGTRTTLMVLAGHQDIIVSVAYSPDGTRIVTASPDKSARVWNASNGAALALLSGSGAEIYSAVYSPDGTRIITTSENRATIWDTAQNLQLAVLTDHDNVIYRAAYSPDGARIATASEVARIWAAQGDVPLAVLSGHSGAVYYPDYSPDGTRVVTASFDRTARVWDSRTGAPITILSAHTDSVNSAAYSPDGTRIVTASNDKTARIWDARTGAQLSVLSGHVDYVTSATYSPDGGRIVTASNDKTARIWDAHTAAQLGVLSGHHAIVSWASYSPDGAHIVTASTDETARIWDARTDSLLSVLSGHTGAVLYAAYSPDGERIVTASLDRTARIWNAHTGTQLAVLSGHNLTLGSAAYSPDEKFVITASNDATARIWDALAGVQLAVIPAARAAIWAAAYSRDGTRIITASADRVARIWQANVPPDLKRQILWSTAAGVDPLPRFERDLLGLPANPEVKTWSTAASGCDRAAAAIHDPDRLAPGVLQETVSADDATSECSHEIAIAGPRPRSVYQSGRALLAKHDVKAARSQFERAISSGYRAARIDLGNLLQDESADMIDPTGAAALYERAWKDNVLIAGFELGHLYENGVPGSKDKAQVAFLIDLRKAWSWYQKAADAGEPNALARFAERDETNALSETDTPKRNAFLLQAFSYYAAAAERAKDEDWPDGAWRQWRYRRATLARVLAREGMMQQVADTYQAVRDKWTPHPPTLWQTLQAKLHIQ
ncbi:MAG: hypothetical protein ACLPV8_16825 [Steroidobacteraceae bacterium]